MPARPVATFGNLRLAPSPALPLRWCPWRALRSRTCLWGCRGLVAAGVAPGRPGWWAPLRRGVVGPAGTAAVGPGARVKGTAMPGRPRVADSAAAAAQFLVAAGGGGRRVSHTSLLQQALWSRRTRASSQALLPPSLRPLCVPGAHLQLQRCVDVSGIWMWWAGKSLLNYGYFISCRLKGRDTKTESQATTMPISPTATSFGRDR